MRITELMGRAVVDRAVARTLGRLVDVFVDLSGARIVAVEVAAPGLDGRVCIPAEWITRIGRDAVMVARQSRADLAEVAHATDHCLNCQRLVGLEVLDERGERVGYLQDAQVDASRLAITSYELVCPGWHHWLKVKAEIRPDDVSSCSRDFMLIRGRPMAANVDTIG